VLLGLGVAEQWYRAVLEVVDEGASVTDVARRHGWRGRRCTSWLRWYVNDGGLVGWWTDPRGRRRARIRWPRRWRRWWSGCGGSIRSGGVTDRLADGTSRDGCRCTGCCCVVAWSMARSASGAGRTVAGGSAVGPPALF